MMLPVGKLDEVELEQFHLIQLTSRHYTGALYYKL
jgi:hypothetical protein